MSNLPPVPPQNRSPKGPGANPDVPIDTAQDNKDHVHQRNLHQQGHQGNIKQNTKNQGYQQDR